MGKSQVSLEVCFLSALSKIFLEEGQSQLLPRVGIPLAGKQRLVASTGIKSGWELGLLQMHYKIMLTLRLNELR